MNKMLYSVVLKNHQIVPFLLADLEQEHSILKFDDFFYNSSPYRDPEKDYNHSRVRYNESPLTINFNESNKKIFIKEFGLFISPDDVTGIKSTEIEISGRYYLFAGSDYYPQGGFLDLFYIHDNLKELEKILVNGLYAAKLEIEWSHIIDMKTNKKINIIENKDRQ